MGPTPYSGDLQTVPRDFLLQCTLQPLRHRPPAEPAAAACNCMGSQQLCHSCSRSLLANKNDHAHSLECASTAEDLQEVPRIYCQTLQAPQMLQVPHPALIHKSQQGQGTTNCPVCFRCFLQAMTMMHALWDMHPPLGTLKRSPELLRHCISCACPKT